MKTHFHYMKLYKKFWCNIFIVCQEQFQYILRNIFAIFINRLVQYNYRKTCSKNYECITAQPSKLKQCLLILAVSLKFYCCHYSFVIQLAKAMRALWLCAHYDLDLDSQFFESLLYMNFAFTCSWCEIVHMHLIDRHR